MAWVGDGQAGSAVLTCRMRFDLETRASPDQVRGALTDFTDRRLWIWRRTLDPGTYELRGLGDDWAEVRERSPGSPVWVVCRYDWSDPDVVRWTFVESSSGGGGEGFVRVAPGSDGGSRVHAEWNSTDVRRQRLLHFLIHHSPAHILVSRTWRSTFDRFALEDGR